MLHSINSNKTRMEINDIEGAEHTATHLDAPVHFGKDQWTVDQIPPDRFFGPGILSLHKMKLIN